MNAGRDQGQKEEQFRAWINRSSYVRCFPLASFLVGDLAPDPVAVQVVEQRLDRRLTGVEFRTAGGRFGECPLDPGLGRIGEVGEPRRPSPLVARPGQGEEIARAESLGQEAGGIHWSCSRHRRFIPKINSRPTRKATSNGASQSSVGQEFVWTATTATATAARTKIAELSRRKRR